MRIQDFVSNLTVNLSELSVFHVKFSKNWSTQAAGWSKQFYTLATYT